MRTADRSIPFSLAHLVCAVSIAGCSSSPAGGSDAAPDAFGLDSTAPDAPGLDAPASDAAPDVALDATSDGATDDAPTGQLTTLFDRVRISSQSSEPNFQQAETALAFDNGPYASATLVVDLGTTCYPFESWQNNPPPAGQNWPADCDAFDRNFEFSLDDPHQAGDPPGLELERAITPFGGPLHLEVDVTDIANGLPGAHTLRVTIPTYSDPAGQVSGSDGGWFVTARLRTVQGPAPRHVLAVVPLMYLNETTSDAHDLSFTTPQGTTTARLEYRATGHGGGAAGPGCNGPAEEFCRRTHTLSVDGAVLESFSPVRTDCGDLCTITHYGPADAGFNYCLENPCGALASVTASRANWCPGSETPPRTWDTAALHTAGSHTLRYQISTVESGGLWRLSATYFAFGP